MVKKRVKGKKVKRHNTPAMNEGCKRRRQAAREKDLEAVRTYERERKRVSVLLSFFFF